MATNKHGKRVNLPGENRIRIDHSAVYRRNGALEIALQDKLRSLTLQQNRAKLIHMSLFNLLEHEAYYNELRLAGILKNNDRVHRPPPSSSLSLVGKSLRVLSAPMHSNRIGEHSRTKSAPQPNRRRSMTNDDSDDDSDGDDFLGGEVSEDDYQGALATQAERDLLLSDRSDQKADDDASDRSRGLKMRLVFKRSESVRPRRQEVAPPMRLAELAKPSLSSAKLTSAQLHVAKQRAQARIREMSIRQSRNTSDHNYSIEENLVTFPSEYNAAIKQQAISVLRLQNRNSSSHLDSKIRKFCTS